jgi:hypothetical protein
MDPVSFISVLQVLSSRIDAKELVKEIQNYFDKGKSSETNWCIYFNPL